MFSRSRRLSVFFVDASNEVGQEWAPACDIYETTGGWLLKFELAGVRLEDIRVQRWMSRITVFGIRRDLTQKEVTGCLSMEIAYNQFERVIEMPCDLGTCDMSIEYTDGLLLIRIKK
jgi:HSP20 family protein